MDEREQGDVAEVEVEAVVAMEEVEVVDHNLDRRSRRRWDRDQGRGRHYSEGEEEEGSGLWHQVLTKRGEEVGVAMGLLDSRKRQAHFAQESRPDKETVMERNPNVRGALGCLRQRRDRRE